MKQTIKSFLNDNSGATSIEYAVIGTFLSITIVVTVSALGDTVNAYFEQIRSSF